MKSNSAWLLVAASLLYAGCGNGPGNIDKVYCQGFIVKEMIHSADHEQLSANYTLYCNGECPGGVSCKKEKVYTPPQANGLTKTEWCGCDTVPNTCDVVLKTYNINGREIKQADCTDWNTCPVKSDSCIQNPSRSTVDTIFYEDNTIKEFHYKDTVTCDCAGGISGS